MNPTWELTGKRWAIQTYSLTENVMVQHFDSERERADWIRRNPEARKAVGKRNGFVKAFRRNAVAKWDAEKEVAP